MQLRALGAGAPWSLLARGVPLIPDLVVAGGVPGWANSTQVDDEGRPGFFKPKILRLTDGTYNCPIVTLSLLINY